MEAWQGTLLFKTGEGRMTIDMVVLYACLLGKGYHIQSLDHQDRGIYIHVCKKYNAGKNLWIGQRRG